MESAFTDESLQDIISQIHAEMDTLQAGNALHVALPVVEQHFIVFSHVLLTLVADTLIAHKIYSIAPQAAYQLVRLFGNKYLELSSSHKKLEECLLQMLAEEK